MRREQITGICSTPPLQPKAPFLWTALRHHLGPLWNTIYLSVQVFEFWPQSWDIAKKQKLQQQQQKPLFSLYLRIGVEIRKSLRTGKLYLSKESIAILNWTIRSVIWAVRGGATGSDPSSSYILVHSVVLQSFWLTLYSLSFLECQQQEQEQ